MLIPKRLLQGAGFGGRVIHNVCYMQIVRNILILLTISIFISASSSPQQNVYGQSSSAPTYTQYTMTATPGFTIVTSSPQQLPFTAQPPPPPPPMFDMDRSRSPGGVVGEDKIRLMSPKYIPVGGRDEVLSQPPPPPRSYW